MHEKTYGKQKVYVFNQEQFPPLDEKQLKEMDSQIAELNTSLREKERQLGEAETHLKALTATPTTQEAQDRVEKVYNSFCCSCNCCYLHYHYDYGDIIVVE